MTAKNTRPASSRLDVALDEHSRLAELRDSVASLLTAIQYRETSDDPEGDDLHRHTMTELEQLVEAQQAVTFALEAAGERIHLLHRAGAAEEPADPDLELIADAEPTPVIDVIADQMDDTGWMVLAAFHGSIMANGHDFGFVEDVERVLAIDAETVLDRLETLSSLRVLDFGEPYENETQLTWCSDEARDAVAELLAKRDLSDVETRAL